MVAKQKAPAWSSYTGFILAAIGASVGLGNIWRFPYVVGDNGGSAFVLVYLMTIFAAIIPLAAGELLIGRMGRDGPTGSIAKLAQTHKRARGFAVIGDLGVLAAFLLLTFYAVIAGWVLAYVTRSVDGALVGVDAAASQQIFNALLVNPRELIAYQILFLAIIGVVLMRNISAGLERANLILMPSLLVMLLIIALYGIFAGAPAAALDYLFSADFSKISGETLLLAIGQGFFSVGVGAGMLITYGAYVDRRIDIGRAAVIIGLSDTAIALLAGFGIFAIVFAQSLTPNAGPGLVFITLPVAFANMPMGGAIGFIFFLLVSFAALTSGLALTEVIAKWAERRFNMARNKAVAVMLAITFLVGLLTVFSFNIWSDVRLGARNLFELKDYITASYIMPIAGLLAVLFVTWGIDSKKLADAFGAPPRHFTLWLWLGRVIAPLGIAAIFFAGILG